MREFEGRVVLITGGNKGIGKAIALEFARRGAIVSFGYNSNPEMAQDTLKEINNLSQGIAMQADLELPDSCLALVNHTVSEYKKIDILINNAALQTHYSMLESNLKEFKKIININLRGYYLMSKYSHEYLKESDQGRIIYMSSVHGKRPFTFDGAYAVSKGAIQMLVREAALEFAKDGITANAIAPAGVRIEGKTGNPRPIAIVRSAEVKQHTGYPIEGRMGVTSDVIGAVCFLASKEAGFITGTTLRIDGGGMLM